MQYLLLALGAVPGASGWGLQRGVEAVGVEGAGAVVAGLQLPVLLTDGAVVFMLQLLLDTQEVDMRKPWGQILGRWEALNEGRTDFKSG